ncbi:MAG: heme lyase CcmF/NrfE family subunit [Rhodothalassiaceae bacterium]
MSPELGHLALALALGLALAGAVLPLWGAARGDDRLVALAPPLAVGQFLFVAMAFASLVQAFVSSDFSLLVVAQNSHTEKPLLYKIAGVWGNHEGSLVLWVLMLGFFGTLVALLGRSLPALFKARVLAVQAMITSGFLLFLLLTSNPFARLDPAPLEGRGLNPLLQDPGLAFHPPLLYLGYVGFSVAFSFAVAALVEGRVGPAWARWMRPWVLVAWMALTAGIALGSWWAYYELGWGGWWFWDPVENASFMPWLAGTALLHSAIVVEKRDALKRWTILLAILTFSLSLLGTFLVRSGVLTSVHAFAVDPARGVFILGLLALAIGGSLFLYAWRANTLEGGGLFAAISRESALVLNNILLSVATAIVFIGTLYPLFLDILSGEKISVGAPYYARTFVPLMMLLVLALGFAPLLSWKRGDPGRAARSLRFALLLPLAALPLAWAIYGAAPVMAFLGFALAVWLVAAVISEWAVRVRLFRIPLGHSLKRAAGLPRRHYGMALAHLGLAVSIFGITASEAWTVERLAVMAPGETEQVGAYAFTFEDVRPVVGPNYTAVRGRFSVSREGRAVTVLEPEERTFTAPPMTTTEAAIHPLPFGDLYAVIGDAAGADRWSVRLYMKPLVSWIWLGALIMVAGGALSLSDRRLRVGAPARSRRPLASPVAAE